MIGLLPPRLYCNNRQSHAAILPSVKRRESLGQTLLLLLLRSLIPLFFLSSSLSLSRSLLFASSPHPVHPFRSCSLNSFFKTLPRRARNLLAISLCRNLRADNHRRDVPAFFGQIIIIYIPIPRGQIDPSSALINFGLIRGDTPEENVFIRRL